MDGNWYYAQDNNSFGPFSWVEFRELAAAGTLRCTSIVWREGMTEGLRASKVDALFPAPLAKPPPAATVQAVTLPPSAAQAAKRV
jgi:hypothetical protein